MSRRAYDVLRVDLSWVVLCKMWVATKVLISRQAKGRRHLQLYGHICGRHGSRRCHACLLVPGDLEARSRWLASIERMLTVVLTRAPYNVVPYEYRRCVLLLVCFMSGK